MKKTIGIIGLGRCGMPAAKKFIDDGYTVYGYARRPEVIANFVSAGGHHVATPADVARSSDVVIVMVLNDEQVIEVISGEKGILSSIAPESTVICMSTINRENLEKMYRYCSKRNVKFVDSPFTGGPARVEKGTLTLIAAAEKEALESVRPVLECLGQITVAGDIPGMGQSIKHCNQLLVTAIHGATIELIMLARKTGVDPALVCEVVGSGIGGSDYFRLLTKAILENTTSPGGMGQLCKDVNIVVNAGRSHNLPLLVATSVSQYFMMARSLGMDGEDSARLIKVIERMTEDDASA
jgi:3-hydroxyisobutyrate dehydrogenase-like beta-hydroxyacid dehydrogenase